MGGCSWRLCGAGIPARPAIPHKSTVPPSPKSSAHRPMMRVHDSAQVEPYEYRRKLPHYQKFDRPLFVTFCKRTQEPLSPAARSLVLEHCLIGNHRTMHLHAVVIMPDHVHLLLTPIRNTEGWPFPLKDILKLIKGPAARSVNLLEGSTGLYGRTSRLTTFCVQTRASTKSLSISGRIRFAGGWWRSRKNMSGSGLKEADGGRCGAGIPARRPAISMCQHHGNLGRKSEVGKIVPGIHVVTSALSGGAPYVLLERLYNEELRS